MSNVTNFSASGEEVATEPALCLNHESWGTGIVLIESTLIIFGNLFVLFVLTKYRSRRFKPLNCYITQLALADMFVGGIILWIGFLSAKLYSYVTLTSGIIVYGILASATSTSTLSVLYIAIDRYIYILKHQQYKKLVTKPAVSVAIVVSWLLPILVFIVAPVLGWSCVTSCDCSVYNANADDTYCTGSACSQMMTPFRSETLLIGGVCLFLLLLASVLIYVMLLQKVRTKSTRPVKHPQRRASEMRILKTMVIVLSGFVLTTGPLAALCITSFFYNERSLHFAMRILVVISNINSIMNPFFYFWRIPQMNKNLKRLWHAVVHKLRKILFCSKEPNGDRRFSGLRLNYTAGSQQNGCESDTSNTGTGPKIKYLNKTHKIKIEKHIHNETPWSSNIL